MLWQRLTYRTFLVLLSLVIENVVNFSSTNNRHSGVYVSNEEDQTMVYKLTTEKEKLALEHEILKLLGFPEKPKPTNADKVPSMKRSAPKFLMNIYNDISKDKAAKDVNKSDELTEFYLNRQERLAIDESDVIVTFMAQQNHRGAGGKPDRVKRIRFDVSTIPDDDKMISAELRLYRGSKAKSKKYRGAFTITVYRVKRGMKGEREMHYVDSIDTKAGEEGWIVLNVTESLDRWIKNSDDNKGFYLSVKSIDRTDHETRPEDIGIVGFKGDVEFRPFVAGFFKSSGLKQSRVNEMTLNYIDNDYNRDQRSIYSNVGDLLKNYYTKNLRESTKSCKLQTLYVSFKDLQWEDWIIAPEGYDAYFCRGECNFPLSMSMNATNHAIIQTLVHIMKPNEVPKPCCTPTRLAPISILYFMDENNVALKKYKNMVVRGCGCH